MVNQAFIALGLKQCGQSAAATHGGYTFVRLVTLRFLFGQDFAGPRSRRQVGVSLISLQVASLPAVTTGRSAPILGPPIRSAMLPVDGSLPGKNFRAGPVNEDCLLQLATYCDWHGREKGLRRTVAGLSGRDRFSGAFAGLGVLAAVSQHGRVK